MPPVRTWSAGAGWPLALPSSAVTEVPADRYSGCDENCASDIVVSVNTGPAAAVPRAALAARATSAARPMAAGTCGWRLKRDLGIGHSGWLVTPGALQRPCHAAGATRRPAGASLPRPRGRGARR
jgi:hypothetical protein